MKITIFDSLEDSRGVWEELQAGGGCYIFQTYQWVKHWFDTIGSAQGIRPCPILISDTSPLLLFPFAIMKSGGISVLTFPDAGVSDYNAPLLTPTFTERVDREHFNDLWAHVKMALPPLDVFHFQKIPALINQEHNPLLFLNPRPFHQNSYAAGLTAPWTEHYRKKVKKRLRADSRRQRNRLQQLGEYAFIVGQTMEERRLLTEAMICQKSRQYHRTGAKDIFANRAFRDFYLRLATDKGMTHQVHVSALKIGDTLAATHWGLVLANRFYYLMPSYADDIWEKYSPGRILQEHLMEWATDNNISLFDFTVGGEAYKNDWCDREMKLYEFAEALTGQGRIYTSTNDLKNFIRSKPFLYRYAKKVRDLI